MLSLDPTSDHLYVGRSMAAVNPPQRIGVIQRSSMEIEEVDVFFPRPHALAVDPHGKRFFTASLGQNTVAYAPLTDRWHNSYAGAVCFVPRWGLDGRRRSGEWRIVDF